MARTKEAAAAKEAVKPVVAQETKSKVVEIPTFDSYAIFQTGGMQYQAIEGKTVAIEKIEGEDGSILEFNEVLLRKTDKGAIEIGKPFIKGGAVKASIVKQMKEPKVISFTFKRRKKVRVKKGHRQPKTIIRIESF